MTKLDTNKEHIEIEGPALGGRIGLDMNQFAWVGGEFFHNPYTIDKNENAIPEKFQVNELGGFVAFKFSYFRLYGSVFDAQAKDYNGFGFKGGLSFFLFSNVALNAEYKKIDFNGEMTDAGVSSNGYEAASIHLSFPIYFGKKLKEERYSFWDRVMDGIFGNFIR